MRLIHVLVNKGDFIFRDWDERGYQAYKSKIKELEGEKYVIELISDDALNEYTQMRNMDTGDIKTVTLLRS